MKQNYILLVAFLAAVFNLNAQSLGVAVCFDGFNDYVPLLNTGTDIFGDNSNNDSFTIEFWVSDNPTTGSNQMLTKHSDGGTKKGYFIQKTTAGSVEVGIGNSTNNWSTVVGTTLINDGNWHHIAFTYDGTLSEIKLYINSILQGTTNGFTPVFDSITETRIGSSQHWNTYYAGVFDEIRIWNTARTLAEINSTRNAEIATIPSSLILYYKCNEGMAYYDNWLTYQFVDATGNGHTGDMYNMNRFGACSNWIDSVPNGTLSVDGFENTATKLSLYPNPATNFVQVNGLKASEKYTVYNTIGAQVKTGTVDNNSVIMITDLAKGMYFLKLEDNRTIKFIKK